MQCVMSYSDVIYIYIRYRYISNESSRRDLSLSLRRLTVPRTIPQRVRSRFRLFHFLNSMQLCTKPSFCVDAHIYIHTLDVKPHQTHHTMHLSLVPQPQPLLWQNIKCCHPPPGALNSFLLFHFFILPIQNVHRMD